MTSRTCLAFALLIQCLVLHIRPAEARLTVAHTQNTNVIPTYEVFEITFDHENKYANPFFDVTIEVVFTSPAKKQIKVGGFHYGSSSPPAIHKQAAGAGRRQQVTYEFDKQNVFKARFAPAEIGKWTYAFTFANAEGEKASGEGAFTCVKGRKPNPGFIRIHPDNPFRFVFDDGSAYFPIGLQDCWGDNSGTGSVLDQCSMEGPFRTDLKDPPPLPEGPMFVRGPANNPQNADVYFRYFSQCGFNLYRFSQQNCSFALNHNLDKFLAQESIMTDELLSRAREYGFGMFYGIFGFQKAFNNDAGSEANMAKVKRFIKYSVDRWGAYVDFWELFNEQKADDSWYEITIPYLKSIDPYHHPVATSWERPDLDGIEINAPHWYQRENEAQSDSITASRAKNWKKHNKPVVVGEQGNTVDRRNRPLGIGGVWDDRSALRMRIRNWTAFFNEIAVVFWNTSYARDGHFMNIWLGPKEREYVRAMQDFAYRLDKDVRPVSVAVSDPRAVRAYGLASKERAGVYLHHFATHKRAIGGVKITLDVPKAAKGYWYSPEDGRILGTVDATKGTNTFVAPEFVVDLAFLVTSAGPPDIDGDGKANHLDGDDDNDGVPDKEDAFPLDPEEWRDDDGDLIGDRLDADDDGDGKADDKNKNGIADCNELDFDGDGVDRAKSVPWDAFPFDAKEWRDTDGDGTGDNADPDDDNDGWTDEEENEAGTDPRDKLSFPLKTEARRYMIVVTGGELLSGAYADGHTYFLTRTLRPLGLQCVGSMCVDDKQADIKEALGLATGKASLVIVTGGLGPTDNDITRQTLSDFTEIPLEEHPEVLRQMSRRFGRSPEGLGANLRRQTRVPRRGTYLKNSNGTAVGLVFEHADAVIVALPGPPHELQAMVRDELVPYLSKRFGTREPGCSLTLRFVGLGQSQIDQTLRDHVELGGDVTTSSQFAGGRVDFTFSLPDDTPQNRARLERLKEEIRKHHGDNMYADDDTSLEERIAALLEKQGAVLTLAEAGSAGALAAALGSVENADRILAAAFVAPSELKLRRLLGIPDDKWTDRASPSRRAQQLAAAAANLTGSQWAVAVGPIRRGENADSYVDVAFKLPDGRLQSHQLRLRGTGELARSTLTTQVLDQLRRRLQ